MDFYTCASLMFAMNITLTSVVPCLPLTSEEQIRYDHFDTATSWFGVYIPIAFSGAGIVFNFIFLYFTIKGMYRKLITSKMFLFMMNKSIADLITSIGLCLLFTVRYDISKVAFKLIAVFEEGGFWLASLTYLALSLVKFMAILKKSLVYRRKFTSKLILKVLLALWPSAINPDIFDLINRNETCLEFHNRPSAIIAASAHVITTGNKMVMTYRMMLTGVRSCILHN